MSPPVTFTLDLEDLRTSPTQESRLEGVMDRLLERLDQLGITGTVFCVGDLVRRHPALIARIAAAGHELAVHGFHHVPLDLVDPERFKRQSHDARALLEDAAGTEVVGFRAPQFSLVPETAWAVDVLADLGFRYSSSVMPAPSPLYGWPGAPATPFRWPNGLVELPCPILLVRGRPIPFLGGTYVRILPDVVRRRGMATADPRTVLWTYCHPWEFDPGERFYVFEHGGLPASLVGWTNRKGMMGRVERVFSDAGVGPRLAEAVAGLGELPEFRPPDDGATTGKIQGVLRRRAPSA
jgi:polysaccharide deacetylase family protein (PEP-CTERM system associated)